jgi:hypothetical protein
MAPKNNIGRPPLPGIRGLPLRTDMADKKKGKTVTVEQIGSPMRRPVTSARR